MVEKIQLKWLVIFNDERGSISWEEMTYQNEEGNIVELTAHVPRVGEYIVLGDKSPNIRDKKCYKVENVFWNIQRKDIEVYLKEVDKNIYPMFKGY